MVVILKIECAYSLWIHNKKGASYHLVWENLLQWIEGIMQKSILLILISDYSDAGVISTISMLR